MNLEKKLNMHLDLLRMLVTLPLQCVADIIALANQIQAGLFVWYQLPLKMLVLLSVAETKVLLGLLELV